MTPSISNPKSESMQWTLIATAVVGVYLCAFVLMKATRPTHATQKI